MKPPLLLPLEIHDLTVAYQRKPVLYGIDLEVEEGSLVGIIGPNGAGKSTLLKTVMGMMKPEDGFVKIFGEKNRRSLSRVGYVPQKENIDWDFPVTAMDVVLMGRIGHTGWWKRFSKRDRSFASECLEQMNMLPYADRQIGNLSGGQQQRVFLARALAQQSDLYLMDEPFAGVDSVTERAIIDLLKQLRNQGKTILVVHHDLSTASQYFDYLALLNFRLIAYGPSNTVFNHELLQKTYGGKLTVLSEVGEKKVVGSKPESKLL
jgi:manganese/zinc/iron transport system ATP- binding protein